mgnify:CR=1 FL=1
MNKPRNKDTKNRQCCICRKIIGIEFFHKKGNSYLGRSYECKKCSKERLSAVDKTPKRRFSRYKYDAKYRGIKFSISFEDFISFWGKPCFYCGDPIVTIGLDRKDSKDGYTMNNLVPCCKTCNRCKVILGPNEFIEHCRKISTFHARSPVTYSDPQGQSR